MADEETATDGQDRAARVPGPAAGPAAAPVRLDAIVSGRVQGVGYRWFVVDAAERLGLAGWVANLPDGRVRCVAEGPREALELLVRQLERGPAGSTVAGVAAGWMAPSGAFTGFAIRSGGHRGD